MTWQQTTATKQLRQDNRQLRATTTIETPREKISARTTVFTAATTMISEPAMHHGDAAERGENDILTTATTSSETKRISCQEKTSRRHRRSVENGWKHCSSIEYSSIDKKRSGIQQSFKKKYILIEQTNK